MKKSVLVKLLMSALVVMICLLSGSVVGIKCLAQAPEEVSISGVWWNYGQLVSGNARIKVGIYDALENGDLVGSSDEQETYVSSGMYSALVRFTKPIDWAEAHKEYYLQLIINGYELAPRQKLTATYFSLHAKTAEGINAGSQAKVVVAGKECMNISSSGEVKNVQDGVERYMVPKGFIGMWSGEIRDIPSGWALCDGKNGTPNLSGRFIVASGETTDVRGEKRSFAVGSSSGEFQHQLTIAEMPSHTHKLTTQGGGSGGIGEAYDSGRYQFPREPLTTSTGGDQPHNNLPPYYALAFIMKL
jgi:microcystin-dependent protein